MDCRKTGELIRRLRIQRKLTQAGLAQIMNISDKTVSKWERGLGCPDVSLLAQLSEILGIDIATLLSGQLEENKTPGGNMKNLNFYYCPSCRNIFTSSSEAAVYCCGQKLEPAKIRKAESGETLNVEKTDNEYFVSSSHEMTKEHYILFAALLTGDTIIMKRLYPEWDMQARIPCIGHGKLIWLCSEHGFFFQYI
ncbi:MAG: helix-turn-helix domain-containing protein [Ruminococcaceae bacterium]|nr:helix-turn-helix domain-containing protein [Oscillospiraceae bacterium]